MKSPLTLPIPPRLALMPRVRGYPVPYINLVGADGVPDFRAIDAKKHLYVVRYNRCALCGTKLGRHIYFTGGPHVAAARQYFEPAVHLDCLMFAMQTCPYILGKVEHADVEKVAARHSHVKIKKEVLQREECWKITKAGGYRPLPLNGHLYVVPDPVIYITEALYPEKMTHGDWIKIEKMLRDA